MIYSLIYNKQEPISDLRTHSFCKMNDFKNFFLLQHKEHYLQNKIYTTYNTTYNTLLILQYFLRLRF